MAKAYTEYTWGTTSAWECTDCRFGLNPKPSFCEELTYCAIVMPWCPSLCQPTKTLQISTRSRDEITFCNKNPYSIKEKHMGHSYGRQKLRLGLGFCTMQSLEKGAEVGRTWGLRMVELGVYARESTSAYQKQRERERETLVKSWVGKKNRWEENRHRKTLNPDSLLVILGFLGWSRHRKREWRAVQGLTRTAMMMTTLLLLHRPLMMKIPSHLEVRRPPAVFRIGGRCPKRGGMQRWELQRWWFGKERLGIPRASHEVVAFSPMSKKLCKYPEKKRTPITHSDLLDVSLWPSPLRRKSRVKSNV